MTIFIREKTKERETKHRAELDLSTDFSVGCYLAEITINKKHKKNKRFN